jgi:N utilization substance protein B
MSKKKTKKLPENLARRRRARKRLMQALYQWQLNNAPASEIIEQFMLEQDMSKVDVPYFQQNLRAIVENSDALRQHFSPHLGRNVKDIGVVENAILLLATNELKNNPDTPKAVILNEAIELAKEYGGEGSHSFINGVLDKTATDLRAAGSQPPKGDEPG